MTKLVNRAKMTTATTGTGAITLGAAVDGYQTFAASGVADGDVVRYVIEDGTGWEIGAGTYTASGTTLTRFVSESSNAGAAINLSGDALIYVTAAAQDIALLDSPAFTGTPTAPTAADGTNTAQIASTQFVTTSTANLEELVFGAFTTYGALLDQKAPIDSPALTGTPTAPTATAGTDTTQIATTQFVTAAVSPMLPKSGGTMTGRIAFAADQTFDGRDVSVDGAKLDGIEAGADVTPSWVPSVNPNYLTAHPSIVSAPSSNNSGRTYIQDVILDSNGHVTGLATATETVTDTTYTAGSGINLVGTAFSHADTSSQSSVNNGNGVVIQDVTLDTYGHVTGLVSYNLDDRYYTESEADSRFVNITANPTLTINGDASGSATFTNFGNATLTLAVADDSHNHIIANVDGLQTALDAKLNSTSYTASDVLNKVKTVDGFGSGLDADTVDGFHSSQFLRRDANDTFTRTLTYTGGGEGLIIGAIRGRAIGDQSSQFIQIYEHVNIGFPYGWGTMPYSTPAYGLSIHGGLNVSVGLNGEFTYGTAKHQVWHAGNDGSGSGLDADVLDGLHATSFVRTDADSTITDGKLAIIGNIADEGSLTINNGRLKLGRHIYGSGQWYNGGGNDSAWFTGLTDDSENANYRFDHQGSKFTISTNGNAILAGTLTQSSDVSIKEDIRVIDGALGKVTQLRGITYKRRDEKDDAPRSTGVIAQDVEAVLPEAVATGEYGLKSVAYGNMIGLLIEAIKEQQQQIDELKKASSGIPHNGDI